MPIALLKRLLVSTAGSTIAVIAASVLVGYLLNIENLTDWRGLVPMALPTAFCFLLTGAAFVTIATDFSTWKSSSSSPL